MFVKEFLQKSCLKKCAFMLFYESGRISVLMTDGKLKPGLTTQKSEGKRLARRNMWRAVAVLGVFCLVSAILILSIFWMRRTLFSANPHFKLKKLEIYNGTFWNGKENELSRRVNIAPGDNLFSINYKQLREDIEKIPGIEKSEVIRILPDKLQIRIAERIPRAILFSPAGRFVVDENAVVIPRGESAVHKNLPVITSIPGRKTFRQGEQLGSLKPSLDLIMMTLRNFPDISIFCVMPGNDEKLDFVMRYRGGKFYRVTIPLNNRGLPYLLSALQTAIINAHWKKLNVSGFNLLFDGRVVLN